MSADVLWAWLQAQERYLRTGHGHARQRGWQQLTAQDAREGRS